VNTSCVCKFTTSTAFSLPLLIHEIYEKEQKQTKLTSRLSSEISLGLYTIVGVSGSNRPHGLELKF